MEEGMLDEGCTDLKRCGHAVRNARRSSKKAGRRCLLILGLVVSGENWNMWELNSLAGAGPNLAILK
ncbi:hypothetical protein U1Q18_005459, partial [Sarracenia purpurea var. burkii]